MNRRNLLAVLSAALAAPVGCLLADGRGHGRGNGRRDETDHDDRREGDRREPSFRREDYRAIRESYRGRRDLPPGLRKKYYRTGKLPPGWEARIRPFPPELVRVLPPPPPQCERGYIDGVAVVYDRKTRIIVDAIDMIGAIAGH